MKKKAKSKERYANELEKLRELNAIREVLHKSDIENAALTNASKDSETVSDNAIDNMLNQLNLDRNSSKDLGIIESIASRGSSGPGGKARKARPKRQNKAGKKAVKRHKNGKGKKR
ncbi:MAG: hypothetical protein KGI06_05945 [Candidatus Micrarchaeota archaeon]|nr:hypothetical protein [Candidatus Micrarchaeota archaeon]